MTKRPLVRGTMGNSAVSDTGEVSDADLLRFIGAADDAQKAVTMERSPAAARFQGNVQAFRDILRDLVATVQGQPIQSGARDTAQMLGIVALYGGRLQSNQRQYSQDVIQRVSSLTSIARDALSNTIH